MRAAEIIAEFKAAIDLNGDDVFVLEQVKEILLPGLQRHPGDQDLLLETALAFDVLVENHAMALLFYEKITDHTRVEFIVNFARCLAQEGDKERALEVIDASPVADDDSVVEMRKDIDADLWD